MKSNGKHTPRVLVIDDDLMVTRLLEEHLTNEGYEVSAVHMAEEGFQSATKNPPDLIMLDVMLPDSTGFQMCGRLRAHPTTRAIPIIVMTGSARWPNQQYWGRRLGANEYILKPFNVIEVGERVRNFVGPATRTDGPTSNGNGNGNGNGKVPHGVEFSLGDFMSTAVERDTVQVTPKSDPAPDTASLLSELAKMALDESPKVEAAAPAAKPAAAPAPEPVQEPSDEIPDSDQLLSQLDRLMDAAERRQEPAPVVEKEVTPAPIEPIFHEPPAPSISLSELVLEKTPAMPEERPAPAAGFVVPLSEAQSERYVNFSAEIFIMVSRLASTRAEEYVADQLLRSGTAVGAKVRQSLSAGSRYQFVHVISEALQELQSTGYWLALTRKVGLLETLGKRDLETTCQDLATQLTTLLHDSKGN